MNWGRSIIVVLVVFMGFISFLAIQMVNSKEDAFDKDYYEKGLAFDQEYTLKQNVINDKVKPIINLNDTTLTITFKAMDQGEIRFKRPADKVKDMDLKINTKMVSVLRHNLEKGEWHLLINWQKGTQHYLYEESIYIP